MNFAYVDIKGLVFLVVPIFLGSYTLSVYSSIGTLSSECRELL